MRTKSSEALYASAARLIPGGVNSPVRAFRAVGGTPRFIARGEGAHVFDVDGNEYVDYVLSWGPLILGHAHPAVVEAIANAALSGTSFGAPTGAETELAAAISRAMPSIQMIRFVNSGTEACMSAIRLARAFTGREKIIKCAGCYHGHADSLLVQAGSGALTLGTPSSPGVTRGAAADTLVAPYNDAAAVESVLKANPGQVACVIIEPIAGNMGFVRPKPGYLEALHAATWAAGALLIADEVMTGFRVAYGGAQSLYDFQPDLTCLGKVIGGGLPVGAFGGRRDVMERLAPVGDVYQAGTLSGNPLAMAAGLAQVRILSDGDTYAAIDARGEALVRGLRDAIERSGVSAHVDRIGSMWGLFFTREPVVDLATAQTADVEAFAKFFRAMLDRGVYLAPSQFEAAFLSTAHSPADVEATIEAARAALAVL